MLKAKGLKPTYQRLMIMEYMDKHRTEHLTAERIYGDLSKKMPMLSMATVYNTLNSFLKTGVVSAITITGTEIRYGYITEPHHHFLCRICRRIIDLDVRCPVADRKEVSGHRIEEIHGYFKGICKDCLQKKRKQKT